jgi:hypothetical protein
MFDKYVQTNKSQTFDRLTQTNTLKSINQTTAIGIQCNKLVFTKNISTQTDFLPPQSTPTIPTTPITTVKKSTTTAQYLDNKLNDLLKQSFNNYTNRCLTNNNNNQSPVRSIDNNNNKVLNLFKNQQNSNLTLKKLNENLNVNSSSSKRVRFTESTLEIDDVEENDYRQMNQDF